MKKMTTNWAITLLKVFKALFQSSGNFFHNINISGVAKHEGSNESHKENSKNYPFILALGC